MGIDVDSPKDRSADARSISVLASAVDKLEVEKEKEKVDNEKSTEVLNTQTTLHSQGLRRGRRRGLRIDILRSK